MSHTNEKFFMLSLLLFILEGCSCMSKKDRTTLTPTEKATFAGGCFWCMEPIFKDVKGVLEVMPGYTHGHVANPTYKQVSTGKTGHYEAIEIVFDPAILTYEKLLESFLQNIDPTDQQGQFSDKGQQYTTAIFYHNDQQKKKAEFVLDQLQNSGQFSQPIATKILPASQFYPAEEYHREYYKKNKSAYDAYKYGSGRKSKLQNLWKNYKKQGTLDRTK